MKDKIKTEKSTPLPVVGVDVVKTEPNLDVEFKKEPGLNTPLCENDSKTSICTKVGIRVFAIRLVATE